MKDFLPEIVPYTCTKSDIEFKMESFYQFFNF
jgi:hypothetical protein